MFSVIIPAHNEAAVIQRCLGALLEGAREGELEVIVVCNGCTDGTADAARSAGEAASAAGSVTVIETPIASKVQALNLGDEAARSFPRFYIDADVVLPLEHLRRLAAVLSDRRHGAGALAAAPRFRMKLDGCSGFVRAFYDINDRMPSSREGIGGSGVYGLSEAGRKRFGRFPPLTADDGFVRLQFAPAERATPPDCVSTVYGPRTLWELVRIKTRSHLGNLELRRDYPQLWQRNRGGRNAGALRRLALRPALWGKLAVYVFVKSAARWRARRRFDRGQVPAWERDESARAAGPAAPAPLATRNSQLATP